MRILVSGPLLSMSGYGNHARQVLEFVLEEYKDEDVFCDIKSWGNTNWNLCKDFLSDSIFDDIINNFISECDLNKCIEDQSDYFDVSFQICFPSEWNNTISKKNIGIFAGIESTICCKKWIDKINSMCEVIVPSQHALMSIKNSLEYYNIKEIETPIHVIPEWFYVELLDSTNSKPNLLAKVKTENNLLIFGQLTKIDPDIDRKNLLNTLDACINTLSELHEENTGIILKIFCENNSVIDFYKTKKIITTYIDLSRNNYDFIPKIYIVHGNFKPNEISSLYKDSKIKCLVSGTRGEGFGLTFLEAAACGIPIIAAKWSAYDEFLDYYLGIDYTLVDVSPKLNLNNTPVHEYSNIWVKDSKWAEFDKNDLNNKIRKILSNDYNSEKIIEQSKTILNKYSKNAIMSIYKKQFGG